MSVRGHMGSQPTGLQPAQEIDNFYERGYGEIMVKRIADWLEKFSVLAAGIGVFQGRFLGLFVACVALALSLWITKRLGG